MPETDFISVSKLQKAHRAIWLRVALMGAILLLFVGLALALGFLQTRATQYYFIALGVLISVLFLVAETYIVFYEIVPLRAYVAFATKALSKTMYRNRVKVVGIHKETETYLGLETRAIDVIEVDENRLFRVRYPLVGDFLPEEGEDYFLTTYDDVVLKAEKDG